MFLGTIEVKKDICRKEQLCCMRKYQHQAIPARGIFKQLTDFQRKR